MSFDPYIHFRGNCAAAMEFYADVFDADDFFMMRYSEMPEAPPNFANSDRVLHATMIVKGRPLMASDFPPGSDGEPQQAVTISHTAPDLVEGKRVFDRLSDGGEEIAAWGETFFAQGFGMLRDRFGTHWMVLAGLKQTSG